ncbi:hypothetical protein BMS3Abin13_00759 [bacterium BMS3Abin13]|nr:hypothetical protein BMS3Abin13_00759 [bacterium BMS3Abin13]
MMIGCSDLLDLDGSYGNKPSWQCGADYLVMHGYNSSMVLRPPSAVVPVSYPPTDRSFQCLEAWPTLINTALTLCGVPSGRIILTVTSRSSGGGRLPCVPIPESISENAECLSLSLTIFPQRFGNCVGVIVRTRESRTACVSWYEGHSPRCTAKIPAAPPTMRPIMSPDINAFHIGAPPHMLYSESASCRRPSR